MKNRKLWGGRFDRRPAAKTEAFSSSLSVDSRLAQYDVEGSIAHCRMLAHAGIIEKPESEKIIKSLSEIRAALEDDRFLFEPSDEDIHTAVERALYEKIGVLAGKLHTGRSRNDQIVLDERLYVRGLLADLDQGLRGLQKSLLVWVQKNPKAILPAFTHLQHSQAILFGHWGLAYLEMFQRDRDRLADAGRRVNVLPLGASAGAGSSLPLDPDYTAKLLGFSGIFANSLDAVSDRDFLLEVLADLSIVAVHLSRLCEELVLWSSSEFNFIEIDQRYCTGSSALPQKKNPDIPELVRGKAGVVFGGLVALLTTMKSLPLSYNRDLQEDKPPFFNAADAVLSSLEVLAEMIPHTRVNAAVMRRAAETGHVTALDLSEFLVRRGMPFREAHGVVGGVVRQCLAQNKPLAGLSLAELKKHSRLFTREAKNLLSATESVKHRLSPGSSNPDQVAVKIKEWAGVLFLEKNPYGASR